MVKEKRKVDKTKMNIEVKKSKIEIRGFPDDVIFIILLYLPADLIYNVMRFVCKQWYNIIQSPIFISSQFENSLKTNCLLVDKTEGNTDTIGYIIKPTFNVKELKFPFANKIRASCNGLVIVIGPHHSKYKLPSYIANPLTKQSLPLPYLPVELSQDSWGFAYASSSKVYKVVTCQESKCFILSVGVDETWREIDISYLTFTRNQVKAMCISLKGFLYWVNEDESVPFILCFDMENETFGKISLPSHRRHYYWLRSLRSYGLLELENSLCFWLRKVENPYIFKFWLLKDRESGNGEWEKLLSINLKPRVRDIDKLLAYDHQICLLCPFGWFGSRELLVFYEPQGAIVYNVNTGDIYPLNELIIRNRQQFVRTYDQGHVYVESLVRLPNCPPLLKHVRAQGATL